MMVGLGMASRLRLPMVLGNYHFADMLAGNPSIRAVVPPGLRLTWPIQGGYLLAVATGTAAANLNFGFSVEKDFGDAPAPYPTLLAENGPMHPIETGFFLERTPTPRPMEFIPLRLTPMTVAERTMKMAFNSPPP